MASKTALIMAKAREDITEFAKFELKNIIHRKIALREMVKPDDDNCQALDLSDYKEDAPFVDVNSDIIDITDGIGISQTETRKVTKVLLCDEINIAVETEGDTDNIIFFHALNMESIANVTMALESIWKSLTK